MIHCGIRLAATVLTVAAFFAGCKKEEAETTDKTKISADTNASIRVVTTKVALQAFEDWGQYSADLRGADDATLSAPPAGGRVEHVTEVGNAVSKGQALCNIDSEKYQAMLLQAKAAQDLAQGEMDRMKSNVEKGYVGKAVLDKAQFDFQSARVARLQAQRAYEDSRCQAPFSGMLVSRSIERYQNVAPGMPTVRVSGLSKLEAVVSIPESEAFDYKSGQKAEFLLLQGDVKPIEGRIRGLDMAVESRNRTALARIEIPNPGNRLRPGMVGKARILRKRYEQALVVPSQAVLRLQDGTAVMRVVGGRAQKVQVELGAARGDSVLVLSGLTAGDRIITMGSFQVSEGTKVEF